MKTGLLTIWFLATSIIWVALFGVMPAVKKTSASRIVFVVLYIDPLKIYSLTSNFDQ
jgi:hypothetical protein